MTTHMSPSALANNRAVRRSIRAASAVVTRHGCQVTHPVVTVQTSFVVDRGSLGLATKDNTHPCGGCQPASHSGSPPRLTRW
jgi:hypothetical protein